MAAQGSMFDGYPQTLREIYRFLIETDRILKKEGIFGPEETKYEYEYIVIELIHKWSDTLLLSKTTICNVLGVCLDVDKRTAGRYYDEPEKYKISGIPYFFFTYALEEQKRIYSKAKTNSKKYKKLCTPEIRNLAELGDKIIAVLALITEFPSENRGSSRTNMHREYDPFTTLSNSNEMKEIYSQNDKLLCGELDFYHVWNSRELFWGLDDMALSFFADLISLPEEIVDDNILHYGFMTISHIRDALDNNDLKVWIGLAERLKKPHQCDFLKIKEDLEKLSLLHKTCALQLLVALWQYRVTENDIFVFSVFNSVLNEEDRKKFLEYVSGLAEKLRDEKRLRTPRIIAKHLTHEEATSG